MKIGVLTSTRADFGIYLPLLKQLRSDDFFQLEIIAFGTHLSNRFGNTVSEIYGEGFEVAHKIDTIPLYDSSLEISISIGETIQKFASFWTSHAFDMILALGDRYEMFAAVVAATPFNLSVAHIHAGETTLGAIDNTYRHSISLMSQILFTSTEEYKKRAIEICQRPEDVYNVGALSIDNLKNEKLFSVEEFNQKFNIDLSIPTILSTFHPETVNFDKNELYISEILNAFDQLRKRYQIIVTMPNADTMGLMLREKIEDFAIDRSNIILKESLGMKSYLSCMKHCKFLLGNTSSGFVEAAFFPKYVINLGKRQEGRILTPNIFSIPIKTTNILNAVSEIENLSDPPPCNIYGDGSTAIKIADILKNKQYAKHS